MAFFVTVRIFDLYILIGKYINFKSRSNLNNKDYMEIFFNMLIEKVKKYIFTY